MQWFSVASIRRRRVASITVAVAGVAALWSSSFASAATITVDDDGDQCPAATQTTIQGGVNAAAATGDTVHVCNGIYVEQVDIAKQVTIDGDGSGTVVYAPDLLATKFSPGGNPAKPVMYVHGGVNGVVIQDLTVDAAGKGNANNRIQGIAYNDAGGTIQNTRIEDVRNTPFDGVQAGVAIYLFADATATAARTVNVQNNQLVRFQKNGTVFTGVNLTVNATGNTVTGAGPTNVTAQNGLQLSGGAGGTISNNTVTGINYTPQSVCSTGVLLFGPATGAVVSNNTVSGTFCALYSQDSSGTQMTGNNITGSTFAVTLFSNPATVSGNRIAGTGETGATGIYADESTTPGNATYTVNGNSVTGYTDGVGIQVADFIPANAFSVTMNAAFNRIANNETGAQADDATLNADNNWWGCNAGPGQPGCNPVASSGTGTTDVVPRLVFGASASPTTVTTGQTSQITASLAQNSAGATPGSNVFPSGVNVAFAATLGAIQSPVATSSPFATSTLTAGGVAGASNVNATLDNQTVGATVAINAASTPAAGGTAGQTGAGGTVKKKCKKKKVKKGAAAAKKKCKKRK